MVNYHLPDKIIENLKLIHNAVVGNGKFKGDPLFKKLFEAGNAESMQSYRSSSPPILM